MLLLFKIFLLVSLIKLLLNFEKPVLCAVLYGVATFLLHLMLGYGLAVSAVVSAIEFGVATAMFVLMNRSEGTAWWLILIVGLVVLGSV